MTKAELLGLLTPFDDEIEIGVLSVNPNYWHSIECATYRLDGDCAGVFVLHPNAQKIAFWDMIIDSEVKTK